MKNKINVLSVRVFGNLNRARSAKVPLLIIAIVAVIGFTMSACNKSSGSGGGGGKSFNNFEELKIYLDKQPVNGPDKPIKISITSNAPMLKSFANVIKSSGKYVSLNITGNALTEIPEEAFDECTALVSITIPNSVTKIDSLAFNECANLTSVTIPDSVNSIGKYAFDSCNNLTNVTFQGTITSDNLSEVAFGNAWNIYGYIGDLRNKYLAGGVGTYIVTEKDRDGNPSVWTKK